MLIILLLLLSIQSTAGSFPCSSNEECERLVGQGSVCRSDKLCSNTFFQGCLFGRLPGWNKLRVCNSEDPPDAAENGLCSIPSIPYTEIRIFSQNWESSVFGAWLMQIVLSEMLNVPATIETGKPDARISFYDATNSYQFGTNDDLLSLQNAIKFMDCTKAKKTPGSYETCAHVIPEVWDFDLPWVREMIRNDELSPPMPLGVLGLESWYVPKFTAQENPKLLSYFGLSGDSEEQRRVLAETFLRPTTWEDYCRYVSPSNCDTPDDVAQRAPDETENKRMFVEGLYTGHFRKTEKSDCDLNPSNCTGHIADYPCSWSSYTTAQTYHLKIPLDGDGDEPNGGYSYSQLVEIYKAANHTRSNVMLQWWQPEVLYNTFQGTDAEFIRVTLPSPTQECFDNRITPEGRCSENFEDRVGSPLGVCDEFARPLQKLIVETLYDGSDDPLSNPAFEVLSSFGISDLQLAEIFKRWRTALTPRQAVCEWLIAEEEKNGFLSLLVPPGYPRVLTTSELYRRLMLASTIFGGIVTFLVLCTVVMVYINRNENSLKIAQTEFLYILMAGALMLAVGSIIVGAPPSDTSCVVQAWLINVGYALELVPLIVKVAALNRLMYAARRMRRVRLKRNTLFSAVLIFNGIVIVFLICWTIIDPPRKVAEYKMIGGESNSNEVVVSTQYYCSSDSKVWPAISVCWNVLLLLAAAVLAFQNSRVSQSRFNESQLLALLIYSHCMFVVFRVAVEFFLPGSISSAELARYRSLVFSLDTFTTIIIYFVPKLFLKSPEELDTRSSFASPSFMSGNMNLGNSGNFGLAASDLSAHLQAQRSSNRYESTSVQEQNATDERKGEQDASVMAPSALSQSSGVGSSSVTPDTNVSMFDSVIYE